LTSTPSAGGGTKSYTSSTSSVCTVNSSGLVAFVTPGTCTITASIGSDATNLSANSSSISFTITIPTQTITYAAGTGGSGTAPTTPISVNYGSTFTTPANTYSRTGYSFAGWSDGTNTFAAGVTYPSTGTVSGNVTLTATWTANTQAITYAAGSGGSGSAPTSPTTVAFSATFTTPTNTFTKAGYSFSGWSDGTNTYAAGVTYPSTGSISGDVTLTATWTADALTVTYNSQGGTSVNSGTVNTAASIQSAPTAPTRTGYTFSGWSATDSG
jgi:uncharacterized repeat protein (TIGR02543 family)